MSLFKRDAPPPAESWESLREWKRRSWWDRYLLSLRVMLPYSSLVMALAALGLLIAEPSWRTVKFIAILWIATVLLTTLGYLRRMDRSAALVPPLTPASLNPTTAVDIRGSNERSD
jgi:hypothetical protein